MIGSISILECLFLFFIYCMIGWVWESCYESILNKKILNRGFLNGPYIPIYGFGGVFIVLVLQKFEAPLWSLATLKIYIVGAIGATILEYVTSYVLEKLLKARWWDYSNYPLNLNGRICLIASLFWGVVAVSAIDILNPFLMSSYANASHDAVLIFVTVMVTLFVVDLGVTVNSILDLHSRVQLLMAMEGDKLGEFLEERKEVFGRYKDKFMNIGNPFTMRIMNSFPNLRFSSESMQNVYVKIKNMMTKK